MASQKRNSSSTERAIVIGLDGATYDVLVPLTECGLMPNLARLMRESALAELNSTEPFITPVAWTTFLTGCDPSRHGILDYRYYDHQQHKLLMNHAGRIPCQTLFDSLAKSDGDIVSLNLPMTYPSRKSLSGIIVGGLDSPSIEAALAPYPKFADELQSQDVKYDLKTVWKKTPSSYEELTENILETQATFWGRVDATKIADKMTNWQFLLVHFQTLDSVFHRLWPYLGIDPSQNVPESWVRKTREAFATLDQCIGELLELASKRNASVVLLSDHGFGKLDAEISLPELFRRSGLMTPAPMSHHLRWRTRRLYLNLRKWVSRRLHPGRSTASISRSLQGILPINWKTSTAVAAHGNLAALVYLNTKERFGTGPLHNAQLREQATDDIIGTLTDARNPETGLPLFEDIYQTSERYNCDPLDQMLPDIVGIPAPGLHTRHRFDSNQRLLEPNHNLPATHRKEGVLLIHSPDAIVGQRSHAEMRDVAPTLLYLLGHPAPPSMQGEVLTKMLFGHSSDPKRSQRGSHVPIPAPGYSSADEAAIESRLRELGYLE